MFYKEIETLLHKSIHELPLLVCNRVITHDIDDLVDMVFPDMSLAVIDDADTSDALGNQVFRALAGKHPGKHITLPHAPAADDKTVQYIRRETASCDALIGTGSGTISDLCKYASFLDGKPYMVFPTAASMNGYLSANASITVDGYKKTLAAHMPKAVLCDLSAIAAAPTRLSKSGLGDSLARPTAQADWLLSHVLLGTPYNDVPFSLLAPLEAHLFENARGIAAGDLPSIELLMHTLLLSGLGMTIAGGSYPASQGEHMIAHAYEMLHITNTPYTFHGEQIGVTTIYMAQLQEQLLRARPALRRQDFDSVSIVALFGPRVAAEAQKSYAIKQALIDTALASAPPHWDDIAAQIDKISIPSARIATILKAADAADMPPKLGWETAGFANACAHARFLRDRFTFLDINHGFSVAARG